MRQIKVLNTEHENRSLSAVAQLPFSTYSACSSLRYGYLPVQMPGQLFSFFLTAALKDCTVIYQARCAVPSYREMRSKVAFAYNNFKRYYRYGD